MIFSMADQEENDGAPAKGGQLLGCVFSVLAVGLIFVSILVFIHSCG